MVTKYLRGVDLPGVYAWLLAVGANRHYYSHAYLAY